MIAMNDSRHNAAMKGTTAPSSDKTPHATAATTHAADASTGATGSRSRRAAARKMTWRASLLVLFAAGAAAAWWFYLELDNAVIETRYAGAAQKGRVLGRTPLGLPVVLARRPYIQWTTLSSAHIVWDTDRPASSVVEYMPDGTGAKAAGRKTTLSAPLSIVKSGLVSRHIVKLNGLRAGTTYRYRIGSNGRALADGKFQSAKPPGRAFSFVAWGDSGTLSRGQFEVAAQIEKARPDLLLHTGDLIYNRGAARDYNPKFFRVYAPTLARVPFYGSLGNHDTRTRNGQPFLDNFVLPPNGPPGMQAERNYSFDYGDAHFAALDSNLSETELRRDIAPWLQRDMTASRARWKFVFFHHPPFTSGQYSRASHTRSALAPLLARLRVDIVFNGHDHGYERWKPRDGVTYIVTAAGGAGLYPRSQTNPATARYRNDVHSFTRIAINGRTLRGQQIAANGQVIDQWTMTK